MKSKRFIIYLPLAILLLIVLFAINSRYYQCHTCFMHKSIYKLSFCGLEIPYKEETEETNLSTFINNELGIKHKHTWEYMGGEVYYTRSVKYLLNAGYSSVFSSEPNDATRVLKNIIALDSGDETRAITLVLTNNIATFYRTPTIQQEKLKDVLRELISMRGEKILSSKIEWDKWWTENEHLFQEAEKRAKEYLKEHGED